jgi:hypothetical protein
MLRISKKMAFLCISIVLASAPGSTSTAHPWFDTHATKTTTAESTRSHVEKYLELRSSSPGLCRKNADRRQHAFLGSSSPTPERTGKVHPSQAPSPISFGSHVSHRNIARLAFLQATQSKEVAGGSHTSSLPRNNVRGSALAWADAQVESTRLRFSPAAHLRLRGGGRPTKIVEKAKAQEIALKTIKKVRKVRYKAGSKGYVPFAGPRLYILGGRSTNVDLSSVQGYDAKTDKWELAASGIPTRRAAFPAVGLFGRVYVLGGTMGVTPLASVEVMSPHSSKETRWRHETDMPMPRRLFDACALNGKIYVIGGAGKPVFCNRTANDASYRSVMQYDVLDKTWAHVTSLPGERRHLAVASLNGRIYVVGGWRGNTGPVNLGINLDEVCSWQPGEEEWRVEPSLAVRRRSLQAVALDGRIYAIGGVDGGSQVDAVESFAPGEVSMCVCVALWLWSLLSCACVL